MMDGRIAPVMAYRHPQYIPWLAWHVQKLMESSGTWYRTRLFPRLNVTICLVELIGGNMF